MLSPISKYIFCIISILAYQRNELEVCIHVKKRSKGNKLLKRVCIVFCLYSTLLCVCFSSVSLSVLWY